MIVKNKKMIIFFIWGAVAVSQIMNFHFNQITYFSYIERVRHHAVLGLIPLSAYGLYWVLNSILLFLPRMREIIKKYNESIFTISSIILIFILAVFSLEYVDKGDYLPEDKRPNKLAISPTIDDRDYKAIVFLKNISSENVVLAEPKISAAVYPVSGNYIVASAQNDVAGFGGGNIQSVKKFFSSPFCLDKQNIVYQNNVRYVLSSTPINCPFFKQIYSQDFRYIYEMK